MWIDNFLVAANGRAIAFQRALRPRRTLRLILPVRTPHSATDHITRSSAHGCRRPVLNSL